MNQPIRMTHPLTTALVLAGFLCGAAWSQTPADAPAQAQPPASIASPAPAPPSPPSPDAPHPPEGPPFGPRWEDKELRELIETIKFARLSQQLGLDAEETGALMQRIKIMKERIGEAEGAHEAAVADLRVLVDRGAPEADIKAGLVRVVEAELAVQQTRLDALRDVADGLDAVQAAKLYLFTQDFGKDIRELIHRARMRRMERPDETGPAMGPGAGPGRGMGMGPGANGDGPGPDAQGRGRRRDIEQPQ